MNWKTSDEIAEYFSKFDTGFNAEVFKIELKKAIDILVENNNILPIMQRNEETNNHGKVNGSNTEK